MEKEFEKILEKRDDSPSFQKPYKMQKKSDHLSSNDHTGSEGSWVKIDHSDLDDDKAKFKTAASEEQPKDEETKNIQEILLKKIREAERK